MFNLFAGGRLKVLVSGLRLSYLALEENRIQTQSGTVIPSKADRDEEIRQIRTAFLNRLHVNRPWAYYLILFELLNFLNILFQIYLTNLFLGGNFYKIGYNYISNDPDKIDIFDKVFPKVKI